MYAAASERNTTPFKCHPDLPRADQVEQPSHQLPNVLYSAGKKGDVFLDRPGKKEVLGERLGHT